MSHFPMIVIGENYELQLAPFDEQIEVEPYLDSVEGEWRTALDKAKEYYTSPESTADTAGWSDQDFLDHWSGDGAWRRAADGVGFERWSRYNPRSKWDWYQVGGRWDGFFRTKDGREVNQCTVAELAPKQKDLPHAILKDGQWIQAGEMGWFGIVTGAQSQESWAAEVAAILGSLPPETRLTAVDCHI